MVSDLRQVCGFLWILSFPPPIKWPAISTIYNWNIVESGVNHHNPDPSENHCKVCYLIINVNHRQILFAQLNCLTLNYNPPIDYVLDLLIIFSDIRHHAQIHCRGWTADGKEAKRTFRIIPARHTIWLLDFVTNVNVCQPIFQVAVVCPLTNVGYGIWHSIFYRIYGDIRNKMGKKLPFLHQNSSKLYLENRRYRGKIDTLNRQIQNHSLSWLSTVVVLNKH
jgi:hypothetical protein